MTSISLPFKISGGSVASTSDTRAISEQKILDVLLTNKNERVMNPRYGASTSSLLFEKMDPNVLADFKAEAIMDLREAVPTVEIVDIQFKEVQTEVDSLYNTGLEVFVFYRVPPDNVTTTSFTITG